MCTSRLFLLVYWCWLGIFLVGSLLPAAEIRSQEEVAGIRQPILVCPPKYSTPLVIPADEVLKQAQQQLTVTEEGFIVQNRPVSECINCLEDAETRAYKLYEYPLKLRQYDTQIRLAQAEVDLWQRRLDNYKYFNKAGAFVLAVENARLNYQESLERLRNLRYERMLFLRLRNLEHQLQQGVIVDQPVAYSP